MVDSRGGKRIPNLFIVGAAKCGTSAMSSYLAEHPDVYMSEQAGNKEPGYFSPDHPSWSQISSSADYFALFDSAPAEVRYLGEASVSYLCSRVAVGNILAVSPHARLIAMVRNPIEIARSRHNQLVRARYEPVLDFETAWRLQEERSRGRRLPKRSFNPVILQYGRLSKVGSQIERMLRVAPADQVHLIVFDDFAGDPAAVYGKVLAFLGLAPDGKQRYPRKNESVRHRVPFVEQLLMRAAPLRKKLGPSRGLGIQRLIDRFNLQPGLVPLRPEFREELRDHFREDVALLSRLINRDLRHWVE